MTARKGDSLKEKKRLQGKGMIASREDDYKAECEGRKRKRLKKKELKQRKGGDCNEISTQTHDATEIATAMHPTLYDMEFERPIFRPLPHWPTRLRL
jgi:hypothetical protein